MSERQPNDIKEDERRDFDDESNLDTARDSRALGECALRKLGVTEATLQATKSDAEKKYCMQRVPRNHYYSGKQSYDT